MKKKKSLSETFFEKIVKKAISVDANSTTCMAIYQPKAPKAIKEFSKIENDK